MITTSQYKVTVVTLQSVLSFFVGSVITTSHEMFDFHHSNQPSNVFGSVITTSHEMFDLQHSNQPSNVFGSVITTSHEMFDFHHSNQPSNVFDSFITTCLVMLYEIAFYNIVVFTIIIIPYHVYV